MTTDCSLNYKFNTWKFQAQTWGEHVVYRNCFWHSEQFLYTTYSPHVLQKEELLTKIYLYRVTCYCWQIANNIQYIHECTLLLCTKLPQCYIYLLIFDVWTGKRQFLIWKFTQNLLLNTLGPLINYADKSQFFTYISIHADYYINKNLTYALKNSKAVLLLKVS